MKSLEDCVHRVEDINEQLRDLRQSKVKILEEMIKFSPLQVGDRATIRDKGVNLIVTIARVTPQENGEFTYYFYKDKKDGTPSSREQYAYNFLKLTKI